MPDKITKALQKLRKNERKAVKKILLKLKAGNLYGLDIKKLRGREDIYRARKGSIRIIFSKSKDNISILAVERRSSTTYR